MFDKIGIEILGDSGWQYSCSLESDKQLQNNYFLGIDPKSNSIFVLDYYNRIRPKIDRSYFNKKIEGIRLDCLEVPFSKALSTGILTNAHLDKLSMGQQVNIKLSAEEFIKVCSYAHDKSITKEDKQKLNSIISNPSYDKLDLSVDVMLIPELRNLDEFSRGLEGGQAISKTDSTWEIYEDSYCIVNDQKIHLLDWLKSEGFDAVVVKEDWAVNIICLYKNMIKDLKNKMPTDSDSVFENYHYSDALLADLI